MKLSMKNFKSLLPFLLIILTAISCQTINFDVDPDGGSGGNNGSTGSLSATINGVNWTADQSAMAISSGLMNISGLDASGKIITLTLNTEQAGTFTLNQTLLHAGAYVEFSGAVAHTSNATPEVGGTVTVTEINLDEGWASGTFSFKAFRFTDNTTVEITNGVFTKVALPDPSTAPNNGNMSAKIDGTTWEASSVNTVKENLLNTIGISGVNGDQTIGITLPSDITVGEHELSFAFFPTAQYTIGPTLNSQILVLDEGSVNITKHDTQNKIIEGSFSFTAYELLGTATAEITEGSFSASY